MYKKIFNYFKIFTCIVLSFVILTGCSKSVTPNSTGTNENTNSGKNENSSSENLGKNITNSGSVTERGKLVVFAKNNNNVAVDMEIEVEFYDANNTIVGSDSEELLGIGSNGEIAVEMYDTPENFDNYKIYVDVEKTNEISYYDQLEVAHNNNGEEIAVQVKNNSQDVIEYISVSVVYYQGDKVVGIDDDIESDIKSGRSANFNLDFPYDKNYDDIEFDNYKVFVNGAYSFNW